jgi:hypothetical protein
MAPIVTQVLNVFDFGQLQLVAAETISPSISRFVCLPCCPTIRARWRAQCLR